MRIIRNTQLAAITSTIMVVLASGAWIFHVVEDWTVMESLYFTVSTTTTVGYGDLHPTSDLSRAIAIVYMLIGTGILASSVGYIGSYFLELRENVIRKNRKQK